MQQTTKQLRSILLEKINACIEQQLSTRELFTFVKTLKHDPHIHTDAPLSNCVSILDFLAEQIAKGNEDVLTRDLVEESFVYIMNKLMKS